MAVEPGTDAGTDGTGPEPAAPGLAACGPRTGGDVRTRPLAAVLLLTAAFMVLEAVGGWLAGSLALLADAGHMLSDVAALALCLFAARVARRPATPRRSYGYYRAEILAALVNGAALLVISVFVVIEAVRRFREPPAVQGPIVLGVATAGLAANLLGLWILRAGREESLNVRGAWLHVLTDALGTIGTIASGALVWTLGWNVADPIASCLISVLIVWSAWGLVSESVAILMEGTPGHIDPEAVREAMLSVAGVCAVHDLHIWSITTGWVALSAHVVLPDRAAGPDAHGGLRRILTERFGIHHITLQVETESCGDSHLHE